MDMVMGGTKMGETIRFPVREIEKGRRIQARAKLSRALVREYAEAMVESSDPFPPVVLFRDRSGTVWLADGNTRVAAAEANGFSTIDAEVIRGEREDAVLYAAQANQKHGQRMTNADKRSAVELVLHTMADWSDRAIAEHVGVSHPFVSKVREAVTVTTCGPQPTHRTGKDGKKQPARVADAMTSGDLANSIRPENRLERVSAIADTVRETVMGQTDIGYLEVLRATLLNLASMIEDEIAIARGESNAAH